MSNMRFIVIQAIACAVEFDDQHCGIYAGDADSYVDFADVFTPIICEYHGLDESFKHTSDMDASKIKGNINPDAPVKSTRIRVGRSIEGMFSIIWSNLFLFAKKMLIWNKGFRNVSHPTIM